MPTSSTTIQVDRLVDPDPALFRAEYLEKGRPAVIVHSKGYRQQQWTFDHVAERVGDLIVPVYDWGHEGPTVNDDFLIKNMPLREAIELCKEASSAGTQRYSVCQLCIDRYLAPLAAEYETPSVLREAQQLDRLPGPLSQEGRRALFISFFRGIHFHNGREVLAQLITGRKKFTLYSPKDSRFLYPRKFLRSGLSWFDENEAIFCSEIPFEDGVENIDHSRFPAFDKATPFEVDLSAGESLFIPSHWWHYTNAAEPCVLVADFWDAPLTRWGFPIGWRSLMMKPYRKYMYRNVLGWKQKFSTNSKVFGSY